VDDRTQDLDDCALASTAAPPQLRRHGAARRRGTRSCGKRAAKHLNELYASKRFAHFTLEIDMTKSPTILTRRSLFRAGAGLAVAATATPLLSPASASAGDARQAGAEPLNGDGFYRFKIGDFQATVISDGYGPIRRVRMVGDFVVRWANPLEAWNLFSFAPRVGTTLSSHLKARPKSCRRPRRGTARSELVGV
jgi:hypothetical protein